MRTGKAPEAFCILSKLVVSDRPTKTTISVFIKAYLPQMLASLVKHLARISRNHVS